MRQQQTSFKILYKYLKSGGIYVIEDLHTSSNQWTELYGYTIVEDGDTLSMTLMEDFENQTDSIKSTKHIATEEMLDIRNKLNSCVVETLFKSISELRVANNVIFYGFLMSKVALIVETREHKALPFVLNNVMSILPDEYSLQIFHGTSNYDYILDIIKNDKVLINKKVEFTNLGIDSITADDSVT